jgi:hypothetical protein
MSAHSARLSLPVIGTAICLIAGSASLASQNAPISQSSLLGTWVLDLARSQYFPGPPPRSETRTYTMTPEGVRAVVKRTHANGRLETIEYLSNYDKEMAVKGTEAFDAVKLTRMDEFTSESVLMHAGVVFGTAKRVISRDGKTMTIAFHRRDTTASNTAVYHREQ